MAKRTAEERGKNPSVVVYEGREACKLCKPLLAREEDFHAKAFKALAQSHDQALANLNEAYREIREHRARLRDARADVKALVEEFDEEFAASAPFEAIDLDMLLRYFVRAYELGRRSACPTCGGSGAVERPGWGPETCGTCRGQGVTTSVTP